MCIYSLEKCNDSFLLIAFFDIIVGSVAAITGNDFTLAVEKVWTVLTEASENGRKDNRLSNFTPTNVVFVRKRYGRQ